MIVCSAGSAQWSATMCTLPSWAGVNVRWLIRRPSRDSMRDCTDDTVDSAVKSAPITVVPVVLCAARWSLSFLAREAAPQPATQLSAFQTSTGGATPSLPKHVLGGLPSATSHRMPVLMSHWSHTRQALARLCAHPLRYVRGAVRTENALRRRADRGR